MSADGTLQDEGSAGIVTQATDAEWFQTLMRPSSVAVIGASDDTSRPGGRVLAALIRHGFPGAIHPVNPRRETLQGLVAVPSVKAIGEPVDVALILVSAEQVSDAVTQSAAAGVKVVVVGSAGFSEIGPEGERRQRELARRVRALGMRMIGPNTNGVISSGARFAGTFTPALERDDVSLQDGPVAIVSQSGALGGALFAAGQSAGLRVGALLNVGNAADVTFEEVLVEVLRRAPGTIALTYMEGVSDAAGLIEAAETARETGGTLIVLKVGTSDAGVQAAAAHTANLAVEDRVFDGVLTQLGVVRVRSLTQLLDTGRIAAAYGSELGCRLTVASVSGGAGIIIADAARAAGLKLAEWDDTWQAKFDDYLPDYLSRRNPIDLAGRPFFDMDKLRGVVRAMDDNPSSDVTVLAIANFDARHEPICAALIELNRTLRKPLLVVWIGGQGIAERMLNMGGVPCFTEADDCIRALAPLARRSSASSRDASPGPRSTPASPSLAVLSGCDLGAPGGVLPGAATRQLLEYYGVPLVPTVSLGSPSAPAPAAVPLPAVVKLESPRIPHKSDVGAVVTDLHTQADVDRAVAELAELGRRLGVDDAELVAQQQVPAGVELLLGMKQDPVFGPVITFGIGGVYAEAFDDVVVRLPQLDSDAISEMLGGLRHQELLAGFRGAPVVTVEALTPCLMSFSRLVAAVGGSLAAIDLNPVIVTPDGNAIAVDALVQVRAAEGENHAD